MYQAEKHAADVGVLVDDQDLLAGAGEALGDRTAGETGADNREIIHFHMQMASLGNRHYRKLERWPLLWLSRTQVSDNV